MKLWQKIISGAIPGAAAGVLLTILLFLRHLRRRRDQQLITPQFSEPAAKSKFDSFQAGISKLHLSYKSGNSLRFQNLQHHHHNHNPAVLPASPFSWEEQPRLTAEAVQTGWPRFAFSPFVPRPLPGPLLRSFCPVCDGGWEAPPGSSEHMQTVRLNPGSDKPGDGGPSWVRTGLPLPGPAFGGGSFPQDAYFEITFLHLQPRKKLPDASSWHGRDRESDRARLIRGSAVALNSESVLSSDHGGSAEFVAVSLGLIAGASPSSPQSLPGTFPGSIGFHSDGSVHLDGRKLVFESEKSAWAGVNRVIGCGFEPGSKKVYFTVDSELAQTIRCTSQAYSSPLYPVLATDADAMILVNLGQSPFRYAPSNATRAQNPSFPTLPSGDRQLPMGYADSRELFSVHRLETEYWVENGRRSKQQCSNYGNSIGKKSVGFLDDGVDAESDLFEISLQR